jgi:hypothetical protein
MTKQEYNNHLERFHKAMEWYHSKPPVDQQEKYIKNFEQILESLRLGCLELNPNDKEILGGFNEY